MSEPRVTFDGKFLEVRVIDEDQTVHGEWAVGKNLEECKAKVFASLDKQQQVINKLRAAVVEFKPEEETS